MTLMTMAEVVYLDDKITKIVPLSYIRRNRNDENSIVVLNDNDFDRSRKYFGRWYHCTKDGSRCEKDHTHKYNSYKVKIFHVGG